MTVPKDIKKALKNRLWSIAQDIGWEGLPNTQKANYYNNWVKDPLVGGVLNEYLGADGSQIRYYIKDSLMKGYVTSGITNIEQVLRILKRDAKEVVKKYDYPKGIELSDGNTVCWGSANNWKSVLLSLFERTIDKVVRKSNVVILFQAFDGYNTKKSQLVVEEAAKRMGIKIIWYPT